MTKQRICSIASLLFIAIAVAFSAAPRDWVERLLGLGVDGGSGLLEALFILAPVVTGVLLGVRVWKPHLPWIVTALASGNMQARIAHGSERSVNGQAK